MRFLGNKRYRSLLEAWAVLGGLRDGTRVGVFVLGQSNIEKTFTFIFTCTIVEWRNEKEIKNMETNDWYTL